MISRFCSSCGAKVNFDETKEKFFCSYCGAVNIVDNSTASNKDIKETSNYTNNPADTESDSNICFRYSSIDDDEKMHVIIPSTGQQLSLNNGDSINLLMPEGNLIVNFLIGGTALSRTILIQNDSLIHVDALWDGKAEIQSDYPNRVLNGAISNPSFTSPYSSVPSVNTSYTPIFSSNPPERTNYPNANSHPTYNNYVPDNQKPKSKLGCGSAIVIAIAVFIMLAVVSSVVQSLSKPKKTTTVSASSTTSANATQSATQSTTSSASETNWISYYEDNGIEVIAVDANVLYEYGAYYSNQTVCTAIKVADVGSSGELVKANTDNNDTYFFSVVANASESGEFSSVSEADVIVIIGVVEEPASFSIGSTTTLNDCHLIATGTSAQEIMDEYASQREQHIEYAETLKQAVEEAEEQQLIEDREEYIANCQEVDYSDVERNPDNYDGTYVVVTGEVLQVSEGLFNIVTLRVGTYDEPWYITYYRDDGESRVLEGDYVTVYGKCTGVTTYISVMGSSITIPSMTAEIIDVNDED